MCIKLIGLICLGFEQLPALSIKYIHVIKAGDPPFMTDK